MRAVRVHSYHQDPSIDDIGEPKLQGPLDVIVKIGGAGVCRTDLHILEGQWAELQNPDLPYVIGHENAGWVHAVGDGVTNVAVGDTVILHPQPSCGLCMACRAGRDMQCENAFFPGLSNNDGGMAEYLRTTARACVKLDPSTNPADVAALADAGIEKEQIGAAWFGVSCDPINVGNSAVPMSVALRLPNIPVTRVENMCATGTEALRGV